MPTLARTAPWMSAALLIHACGARTGATVEEREPTPTPDASLPQPVRPETCDGIDEDADGTVDETCACTFGERRECTAEPPDPDAVVCVPGVQRCVRGTLGPCEDALFCDVVEERFVYTDSVSLVVVVDQSASMYELIDSARENLSHLAAAVAASERSYRLILIASREGDQAVCVAPPLAGSDCADADRFHQIDVEVDSNSALHLIETHRAEIEAASEPNAQRIVVVVSDDDASSNPYDWHRDLTEDPAWQDYAFFGAVGISHAHCDIARASYVYPVVARWTGGAIFDICSSDWSGAFDHIRSDVTRRPRTYVLSRPVFATPELFVGDPATPFRPELWRYEPTTRAIVIDPEAALPPGTPLIARYLTLRE